MQLSNETRSDESNMQQSFKWIFFLFFSISISSKLYVEKRCFTRRRSPVSVKWLEGYAGGRKDEGEMKWEENKNEKKNMLPTIIYVHVS